MEQKKFNKMHKNKSLLFFEASWFLFLGDMDVLWLWALIGVLPVWWVELFLDEAEAALFTEFSNISRFLALNLLKRDESELLFSLFSFWFCIFVLVLEIVDAIVEDDGLEWLSWVLLLIVIPVTRRNTDSVACLDTIDLD